MTGFGGVLLKPIFGFYLVGLGLWSAAIVEDEHWLVPLSLMVGTLSGGVISLYVIEFSLFPWGAGVAGTLFSLAGVFKISAEKPFGFRLAFYPLVLVTFILSLVFGYSTTLEVAPTPVLTDPSYYFYEGSLMLTGVTLLPFVTWTMFVYVAEKLKFFAAEIGFRILASWTAAIGFIYLVLSLIEPM